MVSYLMHMLCCLWDHSHSIVGVEIESKKFPIRYIVELLNKQDCTIIFTGIM